MNKSLLPPSSTIVQQALEYATTKLSESLENPIKDIWNPDDCPTHMLPYLAAHLSVDDWNEDWPEQVKRNLISASAIIHTHKGKKGALITLLAALGVDAEIKQWWQTNPKGQRGTMKITAWANNNVSISDTLLDAELITRLKRNIDLSKRLVIHYDLEVGILTKNTIGLAGVSVANTVIRGDQSAQVPQPQTEANIGVAMLSNNTVIITGGAFA